MDFEEDDIEHNIIIWVIDEEFYGYDRMIELPDNDKFIKNTLQIEYKKDDDGKDTSEIESKTFIIKKQDWDGFPLYELKEGKITHFDYEKYDYFKNTERRMALVLKINDLYNPPSETKILRKTFKYIMDTLDIEYPDFFKKYNDKIEEIITKNPKGEK